MTSQRDSARAPRRGRPPVIDPDEIVATATRLLHKKGFAATTMSEIAEECGISRKSLFIYFPAKVDLIWESFDPYVEGLRNDLAGLESSGNDPFKDITDAVTAGFRFVPYAPDTLKLQIQLISQNEELRHHGEVRTLAWRSVVSDHLVAHFTDNRSLADGLAYAVWTATWDGLKRWAETGVTTPLLLERHELDSLRAALLTLRAA